MLRISLFRLSVVLQSPINAAGKEEVSNDNNEMRILSTLFMFKKLAKAGYLTFGARKTFNYLKYAFIKALMIQHFDLGIISKLKPRHYTILLVES